MGLFLSTPVSPLERSSLRVLELLWQLEVEWLADGPLGWVLEGQVLPFSYHGNDLVGCPIDRLRVQHLHRTSAFGYVLGTLVWILEDVSGAAGG